jgi:hypothetical protein
MLLSLQVHVVHSEARKKIAMLRLVTPPARIAPKGDGALLAKFL